MRRPALFATALLLASTLEASVQAQAQTIRVRMGSHLPAATGVATSYAARCGAVTTR